MTLQVGTLVRIKKGFDGLTGPKTAGRFGIILSVGSMGTLSVIVGKSRFMLIEEWVDVL